LLIISGARYSGVPHTVYDFDVITLANPKSTNFKYPSLPINIFSGFKSLYATFLRCINLNIEAICAA